MKVGIYSAIYGPYEATAKPLPPDAPHVIAHMFTDRDDLAEQARAVGWHAIVDRGPYRRFDLLVANGDPTIVEPMLAHKWWKTHPVEAMASAWLSNPGGAPDVTIWLDGSMEIKGTREGFVEKCLAALGDDDWSVMRHPWRKCVYDEAVYSSTLIHRYDPAAMMRQHDHYLEQGHPRGWGLFATGNMIRRQSSVVADVGHHWWGHNVNHSHQDQLSLPVLFRWYEDPITHARFVPGATRLRWNANLPWGELWELHPHGA